jgi:hypothetical protein
VGVGDSLEFPYVLPGPLPTGRYVISVIGSEATADALVHFDLVLRPKGTMPDQPIGSADARADDRDAGVSMGSLYATIDAPAVSAACNDWLVLKTKVVSGGSPFLEFLAGMTTP